MCTRARRPTTYYLLPTTYSPPLSAHYLPPTNHQVSGAMVHKVKETLRLASNKPLIAAIDHADEAAGEGVRRSPGERPKVGRGRALTLNPTLTPTPALALTQTLTLPLTPTLTKVGETVMVVRSHDDGGCRFVGRAGLLEEDDESDNPFYVRRLLGRLVCLQWLHLL